jgi:hypothetical protein
MTGVAFVVLTGAWLAQYTRHFTASYFHFIFLNWAKNTCNKKITTLAFCVLIQ